MQKRINWTNIFTFYLSMDTITLRDCSQKFQVSYDVIRQKASDEKWRQEKNKSREVARRMTEIQISKSIAEVNTEHFQLGKMLQKGGVQILIEKKLLPTNAKDAQSWIAAGVRMERQALGMNKPAQPKTEITSKTSNENLLEDITQNSEDS